jgi:chromatin structure-remodeling complex subunit RSC9
LRTSSVDHERVTLTDARSAYEITNVHKREPPPKEILEDVSAKGGNLLNRTVENYFRPGSREAERLRTDSDGDTKRTPKEDKMDVDEPGSTGRVTRGKARPGNAQATVSSY